MTDKQSPRRRTGHNGRSLSDDIRADTTCAGPNGPGQTLLVRLRGDEPLRNVPRTAREQGHEVLSLETGADGVVSLLLRRGG